MSYRVVKTRVRGIKQYIEFIRGAVALFGDNQLVGHDRADLPFIALFVFFRIMTMQE